MEATVTRGHRRAPGNSTQLDAPGIVHNCPVEKATSTWAAELRKKPIGGKEIHLKVTENVREAHEELIWHVRGRKAKVADEARCMKRVTARWPENKGRLRGS